MTQKPYPHVSIVIPTRNRHKSLLNTLESISKLNYPKNKTEVIVIDNGSTTAQSLDYKIQGLNIRTIKNKTNKGFAPALNQGIHKSRGKYVFITNDDVIFDKNCLSELVKCAELNSKVAIVGGKMLFKNTRHMALPGFRVNLWLGYHPYDYKDADKIREMDVATGGCMLLSKQSLLKFGIFDEGFFFC
ncbi:glycosyltransferase, partial [Candidatus Woesebacteria bacterium]|nr:glycosyltransferase [Candidatus Woesebacteria bacterium]